MTLAARVELIVNRILLRLKRGEHPYPEELDTAFDTYEATLLNRIKSAATAEKWQEAYNERLAMRRVRQRLRNFVAEAQGRMGPK